MVKSMTGYGRSRETLHQRDITVEVRSVNNRFLDCTVKMPRAYVFAEDAVKTRVRSAVSRGKVDVFVTIDASAADVSVVTVNQPLARGYYQALTQLRDMFSLCKVNDRHFGAVGAVAKQQYFKIRRRCIFINTTL